VIRRSIAGSNGGSRHLGSQKILRPGLACRKILGHCIMPTDTENNLSWKILEFQIVWRKTLTPKLRIRKTKIFPAMRRSYTDFTLFARASILVPRASRSRASSPGPGTHGTGSSRKLAVVSKAHALELGRFSTRNNFHSKVLRRNEAFVLTYVDRIILPSENCSTSAK
jgi:hypothetical protein